MYCRGGNQCEPRPRKPRNALPATEPIPCLAFSLNQTDSSEWLQPTPEPLSALKTPTRPDRFFPPLFDFCPNPWTPQAGVSAPTCVPTVLLSGVVNYFGSALREPSVSPSSEGKVLGTCAAELRDPQYACLCFIWNDRYPRSVLESGFPRSPGAVGTWRCAAASRATPRDPWKAGAPNQPLSPTFPRFLRFLEPLSLPFSVFPSFLWALAGSTFTFYFQ